MQIPLGLAQLGNQHRVVDRVQFVHELEERGISLGRGDFRFGNEWTPVTPHVEVREGAVRVPVRLTQILIEPAGERAAKCRVEHDQREIVEGVDRATPMLPMRIEDWAASG